MGGSCGGARGGGGGEELVEGGGLVEPLEAAAGSRAAERAGRRPEGARGLSNAMCKQSLE